MRFSPDDKYSDQRIKCKKRFGVLKTQVPPPLEALRCCPLCD